MGELTKYTLNMLSDKPIIDNFTKYLNILVGPIS